MKWSGCYGYTWQCQSNFGADWQKYGTVWCRKLEKTQGVVKELGAWFFWDSQDQNDERNGDNSDYDEVSDGNEVLLKFKPLTTFLHQDK